MPLRPQGAALLMHTSNKLLAAAAASVSSRPPACAAALASHSMVHSQRKVGQPTHTCLHFAECNALCAADARCKYTHTSA